MVVFLTSSFVEYQPIGCYVPKPLIDTNGFSDNLRKYWKDNTRFLMFSSDPLDSEMVDKVTEEMYNAFTLADFSISEIRFFDYRAIEKYCLEKGIDSRVEVIKKKNEALKVEDLNNIEVEKSFEAALRDALSWADVIFLSGGHAPTENAFMKRCDLKEVLKDRALFDGIYIGLSAGSVNSAQEVYVLPELEGESLNPDFVRFTDGLGLTSLKIIPHSQYEETVMLDGKRLVDDIAAGDSFGREFYLVTDGSYFIIRNGITEFFGEGQILKDGEKYPLHSGIISIDSSRIRNAKSANDMSKIFYTHLTKYYDWAFELDLRDEKIEFLYISDFMLENGIIPVNIDTIGELFRQFADKLVVSDEKEPCIEQTDLKLIIDEVARKGNYVRTVHVDDGNGIKALNLRAMVIDNNKNRLLMTLTDITRVLDHDWMTDEYSRSGFIAKVEKLLKEPEYKSGYSIVYTNVKGFKAINDLLGSFSGDMVIFEERRVLLEELNPVVLARLESDHFAVLTKTENITEERMNRLCHRVYKEDTKQLPFLIRCGIFNITDSTKKVQYMLDNAKLAEKSMDTDFGQTYIFCDNDMSKQYVNQRMLISEADNALEKREFKTYYQPIVDTYTGEIVSAEALIRWEHSEKGMISPGQFIPAFEKEGIISKIDSYMIDNVLDFNIERIRKGKKVVPCAINLSRVDFYDVNLMNVIEKKLSNQENVNDILKLEVTESAYAVLESDAIAFLEKMRSLGVSLLLDDFGSGMSSLSTLESFEFDVIKLDMGFIKKIGKSKKAESIIKHTIGLSHDIGAKVVAEGVETKEQLMFLQRAGCDMIQGYYFYKPMPEEDFANLL